MNQPSCPYCGNNPVPHAVNWYYESVNVLFTPFRQLLFRNPLSKLFEALARRVNLPLLLVKFFRALRILSYQQDRSLCKIRRAQVLWEEAERRGIRFTELLLLGTGFDCYMAEKNGTVMVFSGLPRPARSSAADLDLMDDKAILKRRLRQAGLPVPEGGSCWSWWQARRVFGRIQKPVIVKPRVGSRGRHSTTFVYDLPELKRAFRVAKQLCFWVMVEEQIPGPVYRATVIDGQLCGVLRGDSPQVEGDGVHTIAELVRMKNEAPHPGVQNIVLDDRTRVFLERSLKIPNSQLPISKIFDTVPAKEQVVTLSEKIGVSYGGSSSEDLDICHPENKVLFEQAAKVVGDPVVGFDFIIQDIARSYREQKCGFIEANSLPFINLHHDPLLGKPQNVAASVWDMFSW